MGRTSLRTLIAPHRRAEDVPPPPPDLYREPENDIELLGEMLHDVETMGDKLKRLPFERDHYRADLRIVRGAAVRMADRCARLLEEVQPQHRAEAIHEDRTAAAQASNKIDASDRLPTIVNEPDDTERHLEDAVAREIVPDSHPTRKNGTARPKKIGTREFTLVESFIMSELQDRGTASTTELVEWVTKERRVPSAEVNDALANLRITKRITTSRLGRGFINRIAS